MKCANKSETKLFFFFLNCLLEGSSSLYALDSEVAERSTPTSPLRIALMLSHIPPMHLLLPCAVNTGVLHRCAVNRPGEMRQNKTKLAKNKQNIIPFSADQFPN